MLLNAGEDEDRRIGTTTLLGGFVCRVLGQVIFRRMNGVNLPNVSCSIE